MPHATPSIISFRTRVRKSIEESRRPVIVLALDGISHEVAARAWRRAAIRETRSVFPTTSSSAWLSSLTGTSVDEHGIPGVVFRVGARLINVFQNRETLATSNGGNLFSDARELGYEAFAITGDLEPLDCWWRELLLLGAERIDGWRFFAHGEPYRPRDPETICNDVKASVESVLGGGARPCLVWCFIEVDRHVHLHGYDAHVAHVLRSIEEAAVAWARRGATVLAHSDHGLVPTRNDARLERLFDRLQAQRGCRIGGAGRTRWIYPPDDDASLAVELARDLAPSVRVAPARQFFVPGSLAERRVGSLMLIAQGEDFVVPPGYCFDHGSLLPAETNVFDAEWRP